jgi:ATP/maltotriose-dependent transcriptional regulator MalT
LCVPLADAVTGRDDAGAMLAEIRRDNLFLTALDDEGRWFRYHQLFRDLLRLELDRAGTMPAPVLHQRASRWFREQGCCSRRSNTHSSPVMAEPPAS